MRCLGDNRRRRGPGIAAWLAALALGVCLFPGTALAYSAVGDRLFPATAWLPQIAPGDGFYAWSWSLPLAGGAPGAGTRITSIAVALDKTVTERWGITLQDTWSRENRVDAPTWRGWENAEAGLQYLAVDDQPGEFLLSLGLDREFTTGDPRLAHTAGATTPDIYFGKGLGNLHTGWLRPLAVTGMVGYEFADAAPRPDSITLGFVAEYSIPYLQSKVKSFDLPGFIRRLTPMVEIGLHVPTGRSYGAHTTGVIAPGFSYAGAGWGFHLAALVPLTNATASGSGVIVQIHLSLDYLFPGSIGRPMFPAH